MQKWSKTGARRHFPGKLLQKVMSKWFWKWFQIVCENDFKVILVAKMEQNCFQSRFSWKITPKSDFKVILKVISMWFWKWFQNDFSCKNGAKLLPVEIFLENYSQKWFQSDFENDFKVISIAKMKQNWCQTTFSWKIPPKSDFKVILKVISKWF